ncbi:MAG: hypothetical protein K1060chlam4_00915 [Candidatus Anoxychlamydiales bacterium]|nr:hypothetical protein [Candidatus Anoxychlamydiales bacterium]
MKLRNLWIFVFVFLNFFSINVFADNVTFTSPEVISSVGGDLVEIATNSTGRYVYTIYREDTSIEIKTLVSSDFGVTFTDTSDSFGVGTEPQIATNSTGKYVYIVWEDGLAEIQIYFSSDFGITWTNADPLGLIFGDGVDSHIETDSTGQFVYATWSEDGTGTGDIKIFVSSNFGATWTDAGSFGTGLVPEIETNSSGQFAYAIWRTGGGSIRTFVSTNFGVSWTNTTSGSFGTGARPEVATDNSGQYVYVIWEDLSTNLKIFFSSDFGSTWTATSSSLGSGAATGAFPKIITDSSSGRYVYAIWSDNSDNIKIYRSNDFGVTWVDTGGSFGSTVVSALPKMATDSSGRYVYATWIEGSSNDVKIFYSLDFGATWTDTEGAFGTGLLSKIVTDNTGRHIYGTWEGVPLNITRGFRSFFPLTSLMNKRI